MTSEDECLDALREAAERLGESPTKKQYEDLGLTPAAATILRVVGGWNEAKERAGLETYDQSAHGGMPIEPKPEWVDLPEEKDWESLSGNQRWYYKNRQREIEKKDRRRARLRTWLHEFKREHCTCDRCGEGHPACLDFHHDDPEDKELGVAEMVVHGYAVDSIRDEIGQCTVLCANCHRKEHYEPPEPPTDSSAVETESDTV